jgi:hypothetical protein
VNLKLRFDFENVIVTEFGVGFDSDDGQDFVVVPVDKAVQQALLEMVQETLSIMQKN